VVVVVVVAIVAFVAFVAFAPGIVVVVVAFVAFVAIVAFGVGVVASVNVNVAVAVTSTGIMTDFPDSACLSSPMSGWNFYTGICMVPEPGDKIHPPFIIQGNSTDNTWSYIEYSDTDCQIPSGVSRTGNNGLCSNGWRVDAAEVTNEEVKITLEED